MKLSLLRAVTAATLILALASSISLSAVEGWDPASFGKQDTLQFLTVGPQDGEHWSTVWVVVIDGNPYIRLGSRAAGRIEQNTTAPYVKIKIADQQFDKVKVEPAPEMADKVAAAMAQKYWFDMLVHYMNHPLTARLTAEAPKASH